MHRVCVTGWSPGLNKVALTKSLRQWAAVGLKLAKEMTDAVLAGQRVEFEVPTVEHAEAAAAELNGLGVTVDVVNEPAA